MAWTDEQLEAISKRGTNILVSAGAGSGKTAVLTERITTLIQEGHHINSLLDLVTFQPAIYKNKFCSFKANVMLLLDFTNS